MRTKTCPKCQVSMAEGFIPVDKYDIPRAMGWVKGPAEKGWWGNVKVPTKPIPITTYRCTKCGFLEHYATGRGAQ